MPLLLRTMRITQWTSFFLQPVSTVFQISPSMPLHNTGKYCLSDQPFNATTWYWHRYLCMCFCCVRFSFFSTMPRGWLGRTSPKWSILCRVGCKHLLNRHNTAWQDCIILIITTAGTPVQLPFLLELWDTQLPAMAMALSSCLCPQQLQTSTNTHSFHHQFLSPVWNFTNTVMTNPTCLLEEVTCNGRKVQI